MKKRLIVCMLCGETKMVEDIPKEDKVCVGCGKPLKHIDMIVTAKIR